MSTLTVRRLLIDLKEPFPVRWNGGDAVRSAIFNSFSYSFPIGEQFYMYSLRQGLRSLPEELQEKYDLENNKGYGTKKHMDGIKQHGISEWHRRSFGICKNF